MKDSRIKILHVTFNMGIGGTEQVIRQIIENSDAEKFSHEILCIDGQVGSLGRELEANGVHVECTQRQAGTDFKLLWFMRRLIKQRKINVMHCHQYTPYFYGVLSALFAGVRVVFTEHGRFYPDRHNIKRRFINPLLALGTDCITAISRSTADALAEYEYMPHDKIQLIYNGIKAIDIAGKPRDDLLRELGLSPDYRYIGTISRLEPIKNQTMMIKAFCIVKKHIPDLKLVLIGDGAKMNDLKHQAKLAGLDGDVIFTGYLDAPQRFIDLFDIFLLSSFSEGASMTLLEAMSLSKPCVVTDVGGNPEIVIDRQTGVVVPSDDVEMFSTSIQHLLKDDSLRTAYGKSGKERFTENFTASLMINKYQSIYIGK